MLIDQDELYRQLFNAYLAALKEKEAADNTSTRTLWLGECIAINKILLIVKSMATKEEGDKS